MGMSIIPLMNERYGPTVYSFLQFVKKSRQLQALGGSIVNCGSKLVIANLHHCVLLIL